MLPIGFAKEHFSQLSDYWVSPKLLESAMLSVPCGSVGNRVTSFSQDASHLLEGTQGVRIEFAVHALYSSVVPVNIPYEGAKWSWAETRIRFSSSRIKRRWT